MKETTMALSQMVAKVVPAWHTCTLAAFDHEQSCRLHNNAVGRSPSAFPDELSDARDRRKCKRDWIKLQKDRNADDREAQFRSPQDMLKVATAGDSNAGQGHMFVFFALHGDSRIA
jgi:hypothetical protein